MMPFIVAGLMTGSIFALAAVGLVLTYKTSGIFNFAQGALVSLSAFVFYFLYVQHGVPWPVAALVCVAVVGPTVGFVLELMTRRLTGAALPVKVVATVGILLTVQGGIDLCYPPGEYLQVPQFLPQRTVQIFGTPVALYAIIIVAVALVAVVTLTSFLRYSRSGVAVRAVVDDPVLLDVTGTSPVRVRRYAWLIGSAMASASGVILAPLLPLDATSMTFLVVTAFGAAAIGMFTSLPLTYLGGLAIGIGQSLLQKQFASSTGLAGGLSEGLPFLVLFVVLIVAPRLRNPGAVKVRARAEVTSWRPPARVRTGGALALLVVLACVPLFAGAYIAAWTSFVAYIVLFLSLGLLVRMSGQVSLAQVSFMAIGVCAFSHVAVDHHWPWLAALLLAAAVAAPVGAVLAIPAIKFPGLYLALASFGFGLLLQNMFYSEGFMFGTGVGLTIPRPYLSWLDVSSDNGYYYVVLAVAVVAVVLVAGISRSRLGRLLSAMADSPAGVASVGTSVNVSRVLVFCLSASLAAVAGVLDGGSVGLVGGDGYQPITSLLAFALIMLTVGDTPWYAVLAAFGLVLAPAYISTSPTVGYVLTLVFGVGAIAHCVIPASARRLPSGLQRAIERLGSRRQAAVTQADTPAPERRGDLGRRGKGLLTVEDVSVSFGGLKAVDGVSLRAPAGQVTGLIGPNGAGKTTTFNACSGLVRPDAGVILLDGKRINRAGSPARARRGLGRTFQQVELFDSLTVRQNVAMGAEGHYAGWNPLDHLLTRRPQRAEVIRRSTAALALCGLDSLAERTVGTLSTGHRRLVELARCVAGPFHVLLLDEPSSGLDHRETERFGEIVRRVVAEHDVAVLLIEHDMTLVNSLCDRVYVLDFGKPIFDGTVAQVLASPAVRAAYLGEGDPVSRTGQTEVA
jgi:ABC-type branched-subunit amino acid transport system ATPase component/branched-subunit amino acid ABC-type transport system permease component